MTESNEHRFPFPGGDGIPPHRSRAHLAELATEDGRVPLEWGWQALTDRVSEHSTTTPDGVILLRGERTTDGRSRDWTLVGPGYGHKVSGSAAGKQDAQYHADCAYFRRRNAPRCTHGADCQLHPTVQQLHDFSPTAEGVLEEMEAWALANGHPETARKAQLMLERIGARQVTQ